MTGDSGENADNRPNFSAYVLLSEPIQFTTAEIEAALREDYPALDLGETQLDMGMACDTAEFITTPILFGARGADACGVATLIRLPGYGTWDPQQVPQRMRYLVPDLADRLARNASYICVNASARSDGLTDRFRAARLCSCLAAVFARLPVALAAYWETGDHFLPPEMIVQMADQAMSDDWPLMQWLSLEIFGDRETQDTGGLTRGLRQFTDYEMSLAAAPLQPAEVGSMLLSAATLALAYGNRFNDGDTLGMEGQSKEESYRIRHVPKGTQGSTCDVKLLVHPKSTADHESLAGPITSQPPPPGVDMVQPPREGFFKRMMRGGRDA